MKASDLLVKALENEGVEYIFGIPGEENLDLLEAIRKSSIKLIVTRHEQAAGFMAATYGRLTGHPGVCLSTLGPGATNLVTAAAYAQLGAMPMVLITGQKPILKSKQGRFQIIDTVDMMQPITKFTKQFVHGDTIPAIVREAFRLATIERPGAVHLELPEDIAAEETTKELIPCHRIRRPDCDERTITEAVQMVEEAKSPLLLIGAGANRKPGMESIGQFIDKTGIPFFNTQMGKGVIDERHPLYLGTAALSENDYVHCAIDRADLIINVGHDVVEKPPFFMEPGGTRVIHINFRSAEFDEVYFPQLVCPGDIGSTMRRMTAMIRPQDHWDFAYYRRVKARLEEHILECADYDSFPIKPQTLVKDVREVMPENGIIALDNGMYKIWFARNYKAYQPNTIILDNALASMGAGLPSAMAACLLYPNRKVLAIVGDGGFMMNSQEIETAARLGLNLTVLILTDSAYGMIKWKQIGLGYRDFGLDFVNPNFIKYAEAYGVNGHVITSTDQLQSRLQSCLEQGGIHIVDCPIDYTENNRVLNEELAAKTCLL
ncbi:acetolactate synthase large subunit [candidate division GN15 bacterium]|nr:acetolactate synthase large subunit [candidate division GN15 bacterium]